MDQQITSLTQSKKPQNPGREGAKPIPAAAQLPALSWGVGCGHRHQVTPKQGRVRCVMLRKKPCAAVISTQLSDFAQAV